MMELFKISVIYQKNTNTNDWMQKKIKYGIKLYNFNACKI